MHVDGFRFDLASTWPESSTTSTRCLRLRTRATGSDGEPGQTDCRAVGRRPRRGSGGQLPAEVDRVERQVPRHRARLLAGRGGHPRRVRLPAPRDPPISTRTPPAGRWPRSTSSPPTTVSRFVLVSTTRSTTRRTKRATATGEPQPVVELRAEGDDDPAVDALRTRQQRNFITTTAAFTGRADHLACDELGRTQNGTTTRTARTTSRPGSTGRTPTPS